MLYAFGEPFGPDPVADHGFGFAPSRGMHNIHMNQGSPEERFRGDNAVGQDGALLIAFPQGRWAALFLKFQSQSWQTDDATGHPRQPVQAPAAAGCRPDARRAHRVACTAAAAVWCAADRSKESKMTTFMSQQKGVPAPRKDMTLHVVPNSEVAGASRRRT